MKCTASFYVRGISLVRLRARGPSQLFRPARLAGRVGRVPCRVAKSGPTTRGGDGAGLVSAGTRPRQQLLHADALRERGEDRDQSRGTYVFSIESCGPGPQPSQQLTVGANQQFALQVQNDDTALSDCLVYYFTQVTPQMVPVVFAPLHNLGLKKR